MTDLPETTAAPVAAPRSTRAFAVALVAVFIGSLNQYAGTALPVFRDALQAYYGLNERGFGLLLGAGMVPGTLGALAGGLLSDRFGARRMLRVGFAVVCLGYLLAGFGARLPVMLTALALMGFINSILFVNLQTYLFERFPGNRRQLVSLQLVVPSLLMIVVNVLAEYLLGLAVSGRVDFAVVLHGPFFLTAALALCGLLLFRRTPAEPALPSAGIRLTWADVADGFRFPPAVWWLIGLMVLHGTADAVGFMWAPKVLGNRAGFPHQVIKPGFAVALASLLYTGSRVALTLLPERFGARAMLTLPGLLGGGLLIAGLFSGQQGLVAGGFIAGACIWSLEYPAFLATLAGVERHRYAAAVSVSLLLGGLLSLALSYGIGWVGDALGPTRAWLGMLLPAGLFVLTGLAGGGWLLLFRHPAVQK